MFYENQPYKQRENYKSMLAILGSLSNLFSESDTPMLYYRAHENVFCKFFEAENLSREDCSADAAKNFIGIGLKTWVGGNDQKVAEFGKLRPSLQGLSGLELVKQVSEYRNERIRVTKNMHGLKEMIYHVVKRIPFGMEIYESSFDFIDIDNIVVNTNRGNSNNTYFSDGNHTYHFSTSKTTLYMLFEFDAPLDKFEVDILDDPYEALKLLNKSLDKFTVNNEYINMADNQLCLRLYQVNNQGHKYVPEKSGLNQWNASGRKRDPDEIYIPYLRDDRLRNESFFPPRDTAFRLILPDGSEISAKVCQRAYPKISPEEYDRLTPVEKEVVDLKENTGKAIMSNPNKVLGKWLLRDVLNIPYNKLINYEMLQIFDIDSVIFTKKSEGLYSIDFCSVGTYEKVYGLDDE